MHIKRACPAGFRFFLFFFAFFKMRKKNTKKRVYQAGFWKNQNPVGMPVGPLMFFGETNPAGMPVGTPDLCWGNISIIICWDYH